MKFTYQWTQMLQIHFIIFDEKKFHEHFWLTKTDVKCLIDEVSRQLYTTHIISLITSPSRVIKCQPWMIFVALCDLAACSQGQRLSPAIAVFTVYTRHSRQW